MSSAVSVSAYLEERRGEPDWSSWHEARGAAALDLAAALDGADAENKASLARELRATMAELVPDDAVSADGFDAWAAGLSEPV